MSEKTNPNIKGRIARYIDAARYFGDLAVRKGLGGKTTAQRSDEIFDQLQSKSITPFHEHADYKAKTIMQQHGMSEKAVVGDVPPLPTSEIPTAEQMQQQFELPPVIPPNEQDK